MRALVVMRGAPGCGKSTWISMMKWDEYTLSSDKIRLLVESPVMNEETGKLAVSQKNDKYVWALLFDLLEKRMERGEFCVIDACHSKSQEFSRYKKLIEKYRYRFYCIDFTSIPINVCLLHNRGRDEYKFVPENVIENIYSRFRNQDIPNYCKVISYDDLAQVKETFDTWKPRDVSQYKKIVAIGDIHGCFSPLKKWFDEHPFSEDNLYVFIGDYIDRGLENDKVVKWLLDHYHLDNVVLLEGNHEKWLREYANGDYDEELAKGVKDKCKSSTFFNNTAPQLSGIDRKQLRQLCRSFITLMLAKFGDNTFIMTHAGVSYMPTNIMKVAASQFINSSKYENDIDELFESRLTDDNVIQIYGHRNNFSKDVQATPHSINLCDTIEDGGNLRIVEIEK